MNRINKNIGEYKKCATSAKWHVYLFVDNKCLEEINTCDETGNDAGYVCKANAQEAIIQCYDGLKEENKDILHDAIWDGGKVEVLIEVKQYLGAKKDKNGNITSDINEYQKVYKIL